MCKYFEKDGILEDAVEEMTIEMGREDDESDNDVEEEDLMDDDRQIIVRALRQSTPTDIVNTADTQST